MAFWLIPGVAALLYLFLIAPGRRCRRCRSAFRQRWFAHRGLHGGAVPENSHAAFRLAAEKGYGIELDVRLTRDGEIVVHHDESLLRLCGAARDIADLTLTELQAFTLADSPERIPTLREVCALVAGRAPLLIEMKYGRGNGDLPRRLYEQMASYPGVWYVESFDPRKLLWFRRHAPEVLRGQLAFDPCRADGERGAAYRLGAHLTMNFLSRPDFIAYGYAGDKNPSFALARFLFRPVTAAWTVKSAEELSGLREKYDLVIFEGFDPDAI